MLDAASFRELAQGRRRGPAATLARLALGVAEVPYAAAVRWRNRRYDVGRLSATRVEVPVVSVGNLTLGGTGKTPCVAWLARWFRHRGVRVSIVSRGYGGEHGRPNDEALELEEQLPEVPHVQNRDRVAAARLAIDELQTQLIVLDDGFQHRRLARDLDLVLLDALDPFGCEHVFPRGLLREPTAGLARAQVVGLSRADAIAPQERDALRRRVAQLAPQAVWLELEHRPALLRNSLGATCGLEALAGKPVAAFCGLGNPAGFEHTLAQAGLDARAFRAFPDHHPYARADVVELDGWIRAGGVTATIVTAKDLVKLRTPELGGKPLWALDIGLEILTGQPQLEALLAPLARRALG